MLSAWLDSFVGSDMGKLVIALLLTLPIAYNRERTTHIMGLRTYPLVSLATCSLVILGQSFTDASDGNAQSRIIQGILAGIGFIGAGAILKKEDKVLGTASAATIWSTGALSIAVAYERFDIAIFLGGANFLILYFVTPLKEQLQRRAQIELDEAQKEIEV